MRTTFILTLTYIFLINNGCYGQKQVSTSTPPKINSYDESSFIIGNENDVQIYKWKYNNTKVSGYINIDCPADNEGFESHGLFTNGIKHEKWFFKQCNSSIRYEVNYMYGIMNGCYKVYKKLSQFENTTFYETTFVDGNGIWKDFYSNGNLKEMASRNNEKKNDKI